MRRNPIGGSGGTKPSTRGKSGVFAYAASDEVRTLNLDVHLQLYL